MHNKFILQKILFDLGILDFSGSLPGEYTQSQNWVLVGRPSLICTDHFVSCIFVFIWLVEISLFLWKTQLCHIFRK